MSCLQTPAALSNPCCIELKTLKEANAKLQQMNDHITLVNKLLQNEACTLEFNPRFKCQYKGCGYTHGRIRHRGHSFDDQIICDLCKHVETIKQVNTDNKVPGYWGRKLTETGRGSRF